MTRFERSPSQTAVDVESLRAVEARFWSKVDVGKQGDCWPWTRGVTGVGYGAFAIPSSLSPTGRPLQVGAHRVAWMLKHGEQPPTYGVIDHLCGNRLCCNPRHLEAVAQVINSIRGGVLGSGFKSAQPKPYTAKDGTVSWRVRFRRYGEFRAITESSKTFATESAALEFIASEPWTAFDED